MSAVITVLSVISTDTIFLIWLPGLVVAAAGWLAAAGLLVVAPVALLAAATLLVSSRGPAAVSLW